MLTRLLLRGGRVIDPASGRDGEADVLIEGDRLADVGVAAPGLRAGLGAARADGPDTQVIDCSGLVVTAGLIDLHVHVYPGLGDFCLHPDQVGVGQGGPTVIDAGTSGVATFGLARKWIDDPTVRTRVLA
ncbi:MAG TPA: hypothetical protein VLL25_04590, partial [Acidimicrobiales bacterium]|nr:hypothetical protein [Acidimicrobiales bacterium]